MDNFDFRKFQLPYRNHYENGSIAVKVALCSLAVFLLAGSVATADNKKLIRIGIIGLDTSHATKFTEVINNENGPEAYRSFRIVAAYPKGSPDIESSVSRVPEYTEKVKKHGVEIVDSIETLLKKVDVVLLETNDGRPHLEQVIPVLKAGKPVFVDKPVAGTLSDAVAIYQAAAFYKTPLFSSSSLRYTDGAKEIAKGSAGDILGCDAYSPCSLEQSHPDLFWYGIHGVESLFTIMGPECESVVRVHAPDCDLVVGNWKGGRIGTFRGLRSGRRGYGGTVYGTKGIKQIGSFSGYEPLLLEIVKFFRTGKPPVSAQETLAIYTFMEAADESKRQKGKPVSTKSVLEIAEKQAAKVLKEKYGIEN